MICIKVASGVRAFSVCMKFFFILNDPPYGTERSYNALRLARNLLMKEAGEVRLFLLGDAAACAKSGQKVPQGYYNIADMLSAASVAAAKWESAAPASTPEASPKVT